MKRVIILYADGEGLWTREKYVGEVSLKLIFGGFNMPIVFLNHMFLSETTIGFSYKNYRFMLAATAYSQSKNKCYWPILKRCQTVYSCPQSDLLLIVLIWKIGS